MPSSTPDPRELWAVILPTGHVESAAANRIRAIADCGQGCRVVEYVSAAALKDLLAAVRAEAGADIARLQAILAERDATIAQLRARPMVRMGCEECDCDRCIGGRP